MDRYIAFARELINLAKQAHSEDFWKFHDEMDFNACRDEFSPGFKSWSVLAYPMRRTDSGTLEFDYGAGVAVLENYEETAMEEG